MVASIGHRDSLCIGFERIHCDDIPKNNGLSFHTHYFNVPFTSFSISEYRLSISARV